MIYKEITPPFIKLSDKTKTQAKDYFIWFLGIREERVSLLYSLVNESIHWDSDYTSESLVLLYDWFKDNIKVRKLSNEELELVKSTHPFWLQNEIEDWTFTNKTWSIIFDVGIYLSFIFEKNVSNLSWEILFKPKNAISFQKPILKAKNKMYIQCIELIEVMAYGIQRRGEARNTLCSLFELWKDKLSS